MLLFSTKITTILLKPLLYKEDTLRIDFIAKDFSQNINSLFIIR